MSSTFYVILSDGWALPVILPRALYGCATPVILSRRYTDAASEEPHCWGICCMVYVAAMRSFAITPLRSVMLRMTWGAIQL